MPKDMRTYRGYGNRRYSRRNTFLICLAAALMVIGVTAAALLLNAGPGPNAAKQPEGFDPAAVAGTLSGASVGDLNEAGTFTYRVNGQISVVKGQAVLRLENPPENRYLMKASLMLEDGTVLYESGLIAPYHYIETAKLSKLPDKGTYQASAVFEARDPVSRESVGTQSQPVEITIE